MKINLTLILCVLLIGCSKEQKQENNDNLTDLIETPETLNDNKNNSSYFLSKRYNKNIIEELYKEALDKNKKLKDLDNRIHEIPSDSIQEKTNDYLVYRKNNLEYWNMAKSYANNISDSIGKNEILEIINKLEINYGKKVVHHENKMDSINSLKSFLLDQKILMKLFITQQMINNYQNNELPELNKLESIIKDLNNIIKESKEYSKIRK